MESKQVRKLEVDINVREEENGFRIVFNRSTHLGGKRTEYVARTLEEFLTPLAVEALKKLQ